MAKFFETEIFEPVATVAPATAKTVAVSNVAIPATSKFVGEWLILPGCRLRLIEPDLTDPDRPWWDLPEPIDEDESEGQPETDQQRLARRFPKLPLAAICPLCGCPWHWLTVYDLSGEEPRCYLCDPWPAEQLIAAKIFVDVYHPELGWEDKTLR